MGRFLIALAVIALAAGVVWLFVWLVKNPPASPVLRLTVLAVELFAFAAVVILGAWGLKVLAAQL